MSFELTDLYDSRDKEEEIERRAREGVKVESFGIRPGDTCDRCRMPYPKKESSPTSKTISYCVPLDESEAHEEVAEAAARHLGVFDRPHWRYQLNTIAYAAVLQDESLKGVGSGTS